MSSPTGAFSVSAARCSVLAILRVSSSAPKPVTASMRRTPAPTSASETILKSPMSPVRDACVPPHSSTLSRPMRSRRTASPYFSSKIIMAPRVLASACVVTSVSTGALASTSSLTRFSMRPTSSSVSARVEA